MFAKKQSQTAKVAESFDMIINLYFQLMNYYNCKVEFNKQD